jgi:hypothetical protein
MQSPAAPYRTLAEVEQTHQPHSPATFRPSHTSANLTSSISPIRALRQSNTNNAAPAQRSWRATPVSHPLRSQWSSPSSAANICPQFSPPPRSCTAEILRYENPVPAHLPAALAYISSSHLYRSSNWLTDAVLPLRRTKQKPLALLPVDTSNRLHHLHVRWFCTVCHRLFVLEDRCESSHSLSQPYQYPSYQRTGENAKIICCQLNADPTQSGGR